MALFEALKMENVRKRSTTKALNVVVLLSLLKMADLKVTELPVSGKRPQWKREVICLFALKSLPGVPTTCLAQEEICFEKDFIKFGFGFVSWWAGQCLTAGSSEFQRHALYMYVHLL